MTRPHARPTPAHPAWRGWQLLGAWVALSALTACALRPPASSEELTADSQALPLSVVAGGVVSPPFCLHVLYRNTFYAIVSDNRAEAWVTDGSCASQGARRVVNGIRLSWRHDAPWDTQSNRQCLRTDTCRNHEQNVIEGKNIRCAAARVSEGNQTAFISSDQTACR